MQERLIPIAKLNAYQRLQIKHDEVYHREIFVLDIARRMNHVALHLTKYLAPLSSLPISAPANRKAFVDAFIMVISASNLLGIALMSDLTTDQKTDETIAFISDYIQLLAELAKACEATDHQEDYPIRATWNKIIRKFFLLLVQEANSRHIALLEEASQRLADVKSKHALSYIFQEKT